MQPISSDYRSTPPSPAVRINHGNPIARGLHRAWFASTGIDHVSGIPAINSAATHNVPGQNQFGATLRCSGAQSMESYTVPHITAMDGGSEFTVFTVSTTNSGAERPLAGVWGSSGSRQFYLAIQASGDPLIAVTNGSVNRVYAANGAVAPAGVRVTVAGGWRASGDVCRIWLNGSPVAGTKTGSAISAMPTVSNPISIATQSPGGTAALSGNIELVLVFNRLLSDAEIRSLTNNPYQILLSNTLPIYADVVSGLTSVYSDKSLSYNLLSYVQQDKVIEWNTLNTISKDGNVSWDIINSVTSDKTFDWDLLNQVIADKAIEWGINQYVQSDRGLSWGILTNVVKDQILEWNITSSVASDNSISWSITSSVFSDKNIEYDVLVSAQSDNPISWNLSQFVFSAKTLNWNIESTVLTAFSDLSLKYDIVSAVYQDFNSFWDLLQTTSSDKSFPFDILNNVMQNQSIAWGISEAVVNDLIITANLLAHTTQDLSIQWDSAGIVNNSLTIHYSILNGSTVVVAKTIVVKKQDKSIVLSKQDKSIVLSKQDKSIIL